MAFSVTGIGANWQAMYSFLSAFHCNYVSILYLIRDTGQGKTWRDSQYRRNGYRTGRRDSQYRR